MNISWAESWKNIFGSIIHFLKHHLNGMTIYNNENRLTLNALITSKVLNALMRAEFDKCQYISSQSQWSETTNRNAVHYSPTVWREKTYPNSTKMALAMQKRNNVSVLWTIDFWILSYSLYLVSLVCFSDSPTTRSESCVVRQKSTVQNYIGRNVRHIRKIWCDSPDSCVSIKCVHFHVTVFHLLPLDFVIHTSSTYSILIEFYIFYRFRFDRGNTPETRGTAFVVYEDIFDAKNACDHLSGFNVCNRYLVVLYYQSNKAFKRVDIDKKQEELNNIKSKYNIGTDEISK